MDGGGLESRMEMMVQEIVADETKEMDLSLRLGHDGDNRALVRPNGRNTAGPTPVLAPHSRGGPGVNFRHYLHQLNASRSMGPWARILERALAPTLQQRIGQLSIGAGSDSRLGANPIPRPAGLGNSLAPRSLTPMPLPLPPPPAAGSNIYPGSPPFLGYPALPPQITMNRNSNFQSLEASTARQFLQEVLAHAGASNSNNHGHNNNFNYSDWSGLMMGGGANHNWQGARPVKRCSNPRCNTTETPMWRRGPLGPKTLCNACGIKYRKQEERRQAREEAAAAAAATAGSSSTANQCSLPIF